MLPETESKSESLSWTQTKKKKNELIRFGNESQRRAMTLIRLLFRIRSLLILSLIRITLPIRHSVPFRLRITAARNNVGSGFVPDQVNTD